MKDLKVISGLLALKPRMHAFIFCFIILSFTTSNAQTQHYIIGPGDEIEIKFWQDPTLNSKLTVAEDSTITLSVGGTIKAAGYSPEQLADRIVEQVSIFNRKITQASVTILKFGSRTVYVMGNVLHPGKYTFENIPSLWDIISEAGGPSAQANLSNVLIVRTSNGKQTVLNVDLREAIQSQTFINLPKIEPGDDIYIPAVIGSGRNAGIQGIQTQRNVLFIYGEVRNPGVYTFNNKLNILEALVTAGGPTTRAKLEQVAVIRKIGAYTNVTRVNVARYAKESVPEFFMVKGGDTIFVPSKSFFRESALWDFIMIASGAAITAFVYDYISGRQ